MSDPTKSPDSSRGDVPDRRMAAASGGAAAGKPPPASVLQALQARSGSTLGVHLDAPEPDGTPVKITDEVKALRDPTGRYHLLGELGRGGVGIVYKGRDQDLGRDVAMKVLRDEYASRPDVLSRFVEEAQIGGQLQHPGIVPVYELGLHAGERPYFAMKLVKGQTLAAQLGKRENPERHRRRFLGIFEQVCQTMAYAHSRHVVHRDLKPANVMIGAFGEVQVVDWGLAKVLPKGGIADEAPASKRSSVASVIETARSKPGSGSQSVVGSTMGTPAYMPPEQALGDVDRVDERSDVFSLGAMLCEILTGEPPYREADGDVIRQAANAKLDGAHERLRESGADEALVDLAIECLAPSTRARPASAAELAKRMSAYLTSVEERARKAEVRAVEARLKSRVILLSAAAGVFVLALGAGGWIWMETEAQSRRADAAQRVATAQSAASGAHGQAQAGGLDVLLWAAALQSAEQLVAAAQGDDVEDAARTAAEALLAQVRAEGTAAKAEADRRERDATMVDVLETLRAPVRDPEDDLLEMQQPSLARVEYPRKEARRIDRAYLDAFTNYLGGKSPLLQSAAEVVAALQQGDIELELATSLDHWALVRDELREVLEPPDPGSTARLREIAEALDDGDSWRTELRALLPNAATEGAALRRLAEQADATLPAAGWRVLGKALWLAGQKDAATATLQRGLELHPTDFDLCTALAGALAEMDRHAEALHAFRIARALRPENAQVAEGIWRQLESLREYVAAERFARLQLDRNPRDARWVYHLGGSLESQGKREDAVAALQQAIATEPRFMSAHLQLSQLLRDMGRLDESLASARKAVALDGGAYVAWFMLAEALKESGRWEEAIPAGQRLVQLMPSVLFHAYLGVIFQKARRFDEAIASFREAVRLAPTSLNHTSLGFALLAKGSLDEALVVFERAVEVRTVERQQAKGAKNAGEAMKEMKESDWTYVSVFATPETGVGDVLSAKGRIDEAVAWYRRAAADPPTGDPAHTATTLDGIGVRLMRIGRHEDAAAVLNRAVDRAPKLAPCRFNLGLALRHLERFEGAIPEFEKAAELFAQDPTPYGREWHARSIAFLAGSLFWGGRLEEALDMGRQAAGLLTAAAIPADDPVREDVKKVLASLDGLDLERLPAILAGREVAASAREWDVAILYGYRHRLDREVVALTEATLRAASHPIDHDSIVGGASTSACCAVRLLAGLAPDASAVERTRLSSLARAWLIGVIEHRIRERGLGGAVAERARNHLAYTLGYPDFAIVRGAAIDQLPESERAPWRALWQRIEAGAKK